MDFTELLARSMSDQAVPTISHVGQIARLQEFRERLDAGCRFVEGDLVTPRRDGVVKDAGAPHLVIAICEDAVPDFSADEASTSNYGATFDMRIAAMKGDKVVMYWVESVYFEPYDPSVHERADHERARATAEG